MSVLLPAGLPAGFTLEPATGEHAAEVFVLVAAEQTAAFGFCPDTAEDVRSMLEQPATTTSMELLVRDADGTLAQWWVVFRDQGNPITHTWISTNPGLLEAVSDELARTGWAMLLDWIREHPPEGVDGEFRVHSGCPAGSEPHQRHLLDAGFTYQRTFWEMLGPVTDDSRTAPEVPGLVIEASQDVTAIHRVLNAAFVGHYGFSAATLENWLAVEKTMAGFDPDLRYLATIDGEPAAAMLLSRRVETEGAMYVGELATLEQYRRRGIASSLLAYAFELAAGEGLGQLALHVDSENTHAAPSVYRRAGLEVRTAFWAYARMLSR
jgi:ribosomal protein S18 acetylase RimI-like enzyme